LHNSTEVLLSNLHFANGVQLSRYDDFVLVAETTRARIMKLVFIELVIFQMFTFYKQQQLTVALHMGVISDPRVDNATISPVLNNIVPNGSMTL